MGAGFEGLSGERDPVLGTRSGDVHARDRCDTFTIPAAGGASRPVCTTCPSSSRCAEAATSSCPAFARCGTWPPLAGSPWGNPEADDYGDTHSTGLKIFIVLGCRGRARRRRAVPLDSQHASRRRGVCATRRRGWPARQTFPGRRRGLLSATWIALPRLRALGARADAGGSERAATPGSSGPPATIVCGTRLGEYSFGALDLLKTISSHAVLGYGRHNRWEYLGLVNEPCFEERPRPDRDVSIRTAARSTAVSPECAPDPFENATKYPGVAIGSRGTNAQVAQARTSSSGPAVLSTATRPASSASGCFPNPNFDQAAADRWDPERYYTDPSVLQRRDAGEAVPRWHVVRLLSRRAEPDQPAPRPERPEWQHLSSNVGAQYFWVDRILYWQKQATRISRSSCFTRRGQGTLDTSFISTDNINNPRTMNAVYPLGPRLRAGDAFWAGDARRRR